VSVVYSDHARLSLSLRKIETLGGDGKRHGKRHGKLYLPSVTEKPSWKASRKTWSTQRYGKASWKATTAERHGKPPRKASRKTWPTQSHGKVSRKAAPAMRHGKNRHGKQAYSVMEKRNGKRHLWSVTEIVT